MRKSYSTLSLTSTGSSTGSSISSETEYRYRYVSIPQRSVSLKLSALKPKMDIPKPHSVAYNKRNQTTYSWYSQSCPSESYFFRQMNNSGARYNSPSPTPSPNKRSPSKTPNFTKITETKYKNQTRPSSSYAYDGGVFCNATPRADYFVIDPEWVSETDTIKKLSLTERKVRSKTLPVRRRCKSAPPPKHRNPITWE